MGDEHHEHDEDEHREHHEHDDEHEFDNHNGADGNGGADTQGAHMGVEATMTIGDKANAIAVPVLSGAATFPQINEVRIVTMVGILDQYRLAEVQRAVIACIDFFRDGNYGGFGASSMGIITSLANPKGSVRADPVANNIVDDDIGLMLAGSTISSGSTNIIENAHRQLLAFMNENQQLT